MKHLLQRMYRNAPVALFLALLAACWELGVRWLQVPKFIVPPLSDILISLWNTRDLLAKHAAVTLGESLLGLLLSVVFGVAIAVWIHFSNAAQKMVYPLVVASQTIPIIALSPVMVMWFGYAVWSKAAVVILFTFFPITVNTIDGFRSSDRDLVELMRSMGARRRDLFWKLQVPSALPAFFTGLKIAATISVAGATIGEWLGAESGLGMYSKRASNMMRADAVFAAVIVLSLLGIALFLAAKGLERYMLRWQHKR